MKNMKCKCKTYYRKGSTVTTFFDLTEVRVIDTHLVEMDDMDEFLLGIQLTIK